MGKKSYNSKARQPSDVVINKSEEKNIQIEFADNNEYGGYDEANALVLPFKKRQTVRTKEKHTVTRILSKKQRKKLEKIVDKKKKKENRASLLEALASVQVSGEELKNYTSISAAQTIGVKNLHKLEKIQNKTKVDNDKKGHRISSIAGINKRKRLALLSTYNESSNSDDESTENKKAKSNNVIGLEVSEDDESEAESNTENPDPNLHVTNKKQNNAWIEEEITTVEEEELKPNIEETSPQKSPAQILKVDKPCWYVYVSRTIEMQTARLKLPILGEEQEIMETINENQFIIIAGETGSGKTTQVPQFLYEAGYAEKKMIGITEPRRVAAISMSKRVAKEMNLSEKEVSYLIRFEGNVTDKTKIKFMTDGVLLKEIESDFLLLKYSVIILDEAHERSAYTDILIGLLSRIVPLRIKKGIPLKLIIMSATLRVEDFTENVKLFEIPPPVIKVEARQFPVTIHFQKKTFDDYVKEAYKKTVKIHSKLPEGGILIFVTGQQEVNYLVRKLRKQFPYTNDQKNNKNPQNKNHAKYGKTKDKSDIEFDMRRAIKNSKKSKKKLASHFSLPKINLDDYKLPTDDTDADLLEDYDKNQEDFEDDSENDDDFNIESEGVQVTKQPLWVLPLYSLLSSEKQSRAFEPSPEGCRLCVVSTNVAETSLTIPNIKYIVDSGRQKVRLYDKITGVSSFVVSFTSKASADQRAGRAGRVSAGHCYRLYSSAVFNNEFEDFAIPDIQKKPVDDLILQMKCMRIDKVVNFPFPSPLDTTQLQTAEQRLILLGALEEAKANGKVGDEYVAKATPLGKAISAFPVAPRYGKMLTLSHQKNLLPYTVCIVAALSVQEVLLEVSLDRESESGSGKKSKWSHKRRSWAGKGNSLLLGDPMVLLKAVGASEFAGSQGDLQDFCEENGLRPKAITEIRKLRIQLTNEINLSIPGVELYVDPKMNPPTDAQAKFLRQILLSGMVDHVARKIHDDELKNKESKRKFKYAYQTPEMEDPVFMHSSSVLKKTRPEWVIYQEVFELQNGDSRKMFIRGITAIEPEWLLIYVPKLCNIRNIKEDPQPKYNSTDGKVYCYVDATFGKAGWELPLTEIEMPLGEKACKYFGMFFLNGDVCPKLSEYKKKLKSSPSSITKSWSNLNSFVANFTKAILGRQVNSRQKLFRIWEREPTFLLQEYADLLYEVQLAELTLFWPPVEAEIV